MDLDCYKVLGVPLTANDAEVRQAYKRMALRWHPDKNLHDRVTAEAMFKKVAAAYKVLIDPVQRRRYDSEAAARASVPGPPPAAAAAGGSRPGAAEHRASAPTAAAPVGSAGVSGLLGRALDAVTGAAARARAEEEAAEREAAYNLFEEFFGKDPFKDFDRLFEDPTPATLDAYIASNFDGSLAGRSSSSTAPAPGSATRCTTTSTSATLGPHGLVTNTVTRHEEPLRQQSQRHVASPAPVKAAAAAHPAPPGQAALGAAPRGWRVRCLSSLGVAYRRTPEVQDRLLDVRGPIRGDVVAALDAPTGGWVRCPKGWLPLSIDGAPVIDVLPATSALRARCAAQLGVAYRASMDLDNRLVGVRGPNLGDIVEVEERLGSWLRTSTGWLPLDVGGQPVFELLDELAPAALEAAARAAAAEAHRAAALRAEALAAEKLRSAGSGFVGLRLARYILPAMPVVMSGIYFGFRASAMAVRIWCRATFGVFSFWLR